MSESFFRFATRDDGTEIQVEIEVESWGSPAQTYGPPEDCDPGEGVECFVKNAWLLDVSGDCGAESVDLTSAERERIEIAFCEDPPEQDYGYDYADRWED